MRKAASAFGWRYTERHSCDHVLVGGSQCILDLVLDCGNSGLHKVLWVTLMTTSSSWGRRGTTS